MIYYVSAICVDDGPTGVPEEYSLKVGPYDTYERAEKVADSMASERWISGSNIYYCIKIITEENKI